MSDESNLYPETVANPRAEIKRLMETIKTGSESINAIVESPKDGEMQVGIETPIALANVAANIQIDGHEFIGDQFFLGVLAGDLAENGTDIVIRYPNFDEQKKIVSHTEINISESKILETLTTLAKSLGVSPYLIGRQLYYSAETLMHTWDGVDPASEHDKYYGDVGILLMNNSPVPVGF